MEKTELTESMELMEKMQQCITPNGLHQLAGQGLREIGTLALLPPILLKIMLRME